MEEKAKYYAPDISEFHVGFEYVFRRIGEDEEAFENATIKDTAQLKDIWETVYDLRVKYLDKEDIENLGWTSGIILHELESGDELVDGYEIGDGVNWHTLVKNIDNIIITKKAYTSLITQEWKLLFDGNIKNKSELKRLMQQLNIKL